MFTPPSQGFLSDNYMIHVMPSASCLCCVSHSHPVHLSSCLLWCCTKQCIVLCPIALPLVSSCHCPLSVPSSRPSCLLVPMLCCPRVMLVRPFEWRRGLSLPLVSFVSLQSQGYHSIFLMNHQFLHKTSSLMSLFLIMCTCVWTEGKGCLSSNQTFCFFEAL